MLNNRNIFRYVLSLKKIVNNCFIDISNIKINQMCFWSLKEWTVSVMHVSLLCCVFALCRVNKSLDENKWRCKKKVVK